jgi:mRNA interferase MazF
MSSLHLPIYQFGDVLLMSFPFSNLVGSKRRPALVLLDTEDRDVIVARITSQNAQTAFDANLTDWHEAGLRLPSVVRIHKIASLEKQLIERRMGSLTPNDLVQVQRAMQSLWASILPS